MGSKQSNVATQYFFFQETNFGSKKSLKKLDVLLKLNFYRNITKTLKTDKSFFKRLFNFKNQLSIACTQGVMKSHQMSPFCLQKEVLGEKIII